MNLFFQLLNISRGFVVSALCLFIFTACSQSKKEISIDVSQLSLSGSSLGGVMVWAVNENGKRFATLVNSSTPNQRISVPLGKWDFYAIGWSGPGHLEGESLCGHATKELLEDEEQVSIVANPINCQRLDYTKPGLIEGNSFKALRLVTCSNFDALSGSLECDSNPGTVLSFKVSLLQYGHSDIDDDEFREGLISQCQTGFSLSQLDSQVRIPTGLPSSANLFSVKLEVFDSASCSGNSDVFRFQSGQSFSKERSKLDFASENLSILLSDSDGVSPNPTPIVISNAVLSLSATPAPTEIAGSSFPIVVRIEDQAGDLIVSGADSTANVTVSLQSGTGSILGATTVQAINGIADFSSSGLNIQLAGAKTLLIEKEDTSGSGGTVAATTTHGFNISHSTSSAINIITEPSTTIAGAELSPVVEILDTYGNRVTTGADSTALVTISKASGPGTLGGTVTKNLVNGLVNFSGNGLYIDLVGAHSLNIDAASLGTSVTSGFSISHGPASQLIYLTQPTNVEVGNNISAVVEIQDAFGNTITSGSDATANVTLSKVSGSGTFSGTLTEAAISGVVTFSDNSISTATADTYQLQASKADTSGGGGTGPLTLNSNSFNVTIPNAITLGSFSTNSVTTNGFNALVNYSGDNDGDATVNFCYCNNTDSPGCPPTGGTCTAMIDGGSNYNISITGLTAPNDPGDTFNIAIDANDPDGVNSPPADSTVTLALPPPPTPINVTISDADGIYGIGSNLSVQIDFSSNVTVTGNPRILLETGTTDQYATYTSGSGGTSLLFSYTVVSGDVSGDLDYVATNSLELNGGTINDSFAQAAALTLPAPGGANSIGANKNIVIDGVPPGVPTSLTLVSPASSPGTDSTPTLGATGITDGDTIEIHTNGSCTNLVGSGTVSAGVVNINVSPLGGDGTYQFYGRAIDPVGNISNCMGAPLVYDLDTTAPLTPALDQLTGNFRTSFTVTFSNSNSDPNFDDYYYTTDGSAPTCGSTPGGSFVVPEGTPGAILTLRVVACDLAGNVSAESFESYTYILPVVTNKFDNAPNWNDYVVDPSDTASAACSGGGACFHGGQELKVEVQGFATCGGLSIIDSLGVYEWGSCNDGSGTATFTTRGFAIGKNVADVLDPSSWKNLDVTISGIPNSITPIMSDSNPPYSNPVEDLSGIVLSNSTAVLADLGKVYTYSANLDMGGLSIENDKISIVNLGGVGSSLRLTNGYSGGNNCNYSAGGTTTPDSHCMLVSLSQKYLYIQAEIIGSLGSGRTDFGVHFHTISHSKVFGSYIHHGNDTALFLKDSFENEFYGIDLGNFSDTPAAVLGSTYGSGLYLENSDFNRFTYTKVQNVGVYGIFINTGSTNNRFFDFDLQNSGDHGVWIDSSSHENKFVNMTLSNFQDNTDSAGIYVDGADDLIFTNVTVANSDLDGMLMYNSQGSIFQNITFANNADYGFYMGDLCQRTSFQQFLTMNNGGIGFHSNLASDVFLSDSGSFSNGSYGLQVDYDGTQIQVGGRLKVGGNGTECFIDPGDQITDGTCAANTGSGGSYAFQGSVDIASRFAADVQANNQAYDAVLFGSSSWYSSLSLSQHQVKFFSKQMTSFPGSEPRGACLAGATCEEFSVDLLSVDSVLRGVISAPANGNVSFTHTFESIGSTNVLIGARELLPHEAKENGLPMPPPTANQNGLCESNEHCVLTPNIGHYQGHGSIVPSAPNNIGGGGTIVNVQMFQYSNNGH